MSENVAVHHVCVAVNNISGEHTAVAHATQWLNECAGSVDSFTDVGIERVRERMYVHFKARMDDEQVQSIEDNDAFTYLECVS